MYTRGAIYVDMAKNLVHLEFQCHLNTHETLAATAGFEWMCLDAGVIPQKYLSDNGSVFTSREYMAHLRHISQISRFAGVGAHHHNGVADWAIQTIMSIARTMMLHAAIHWPDMADPSLWPMAVQHAICTTMCPALPQDSAPTINSSRLDGLKPSSMTSMCGVVQSTCWTRPSLTARSFPAGRPGLTVKSSWASAPSIPAPSLGAQPGNRCHHTPVPCGVRQQIHHHWYQRRLPAQPQLRPVDQALW